MEFRPYQKEAKEAILREWNNGNKRTLLVLPTGCGKTIVFSSVIEEITKTPDTKVLILAHRDELIRQAADKLKIVTGIEAGIEKAEETVIDKKDEYNVVVGSVQSMAGKRLDNYPVDYFTHIIVDEAHHAITNTYASVFAHFPNANILGVTATPKRADKKSLIKVFDTICYEYSLKDAIRDGYLSPIKAQCIPINLDISNVSVNAGDFSPGELSSAIEPYLEQIAEKMKEYCEDRKTLIFTPLVKTSKLFTDILNNQGFRAVEVNGQSNNRKDVLEGFSKGRYNVCVNSALLSEGYDEPSIDCVICLRPTKSTGLYSQIIGRGTRLCPGKNDLLILDFLWQTKQHDLCHPASLVATNDEIAKKMCHLIDESGQAKDLNDLEIEAIESIERDREAALAAQLAMLRNQRAEFISSLQFFASLGQLQLLDADYLYEWEEDEPTSKQIATLEKYGLDTTQITTKGLASRILDILENRRKEGLSTIKQIKLLERYGFRHVGEWKFEEASDMIDIIAKNRWKLPREIATTTYLPESLKKK